MSLHSGCSLVKSTTANTLPKLLTIKPNQGAINYHAWRVGQQLHVKKLNHRVSSMPRSACRSEVGSFRNLRGTNWLVVWAEHDGGKETEQAQETSPPPETGFAGTVMDMSAVVQIFFAAFFYIIIFFGASVGDGKFGGRRGPRR
eukprot:TRINITY_DN460_c0_g1_i1.p1 TRINITY_DN460_c0_g1~~TRINITY_DN460_c0_g1_i1.p1  ORF type:complete len:144 (-),score=6.53 TRINITY_DN460_c0_g1_i1:631-1062(-)